MIDKIKRELYLQVKEHLSAKEISVIIGPRQVGKTTLLLDLKSELEQHGKQTLFLNLDSEKDAEHLNSQDALIRKIELELGKGSGFIFIDEIQRKIDAGRFIKGIYDMNLPYKFIISGSGSLELKEKIHESLLGRKRSFELLPVSLEEFIHFKTDYRYLHKLTQFFQIEIATARALLLEYLNFGGYPRVITEPLLSEKLKIIDELFNSYIEKDIVYLLKVERTEAFSKLIRLSASQIGMIVNYSDFAASVSISVPTLQNYLWYAEKTFIIKTITPFFKNITKEISKSPTLYFIDLGLRNYALGLTGNIQNPVELGLLFQNLICHILEEKLRWKSWKLHFWRTTDRAEVDFVVNKSHEVLPIEVKFSELNNKKIGRSLKSFILKYQPPEAWVINLKLADEMYVEKTRVRFMTIFDLIAENY